MTFGDSREPAGKGPRSVPKPKRLAHLRADPRGYPIIAAIGQEPGDIDFGALSEPRKLALATFDLCAVCALAEQLALHLMIDDAAEAQDADDLGPPEQLPESRFDNDFDSLYDVLFDDTDHTGLLQPQTPRPPGQLDYLFEAFHNVEDRDPHRGYRR